MTKMISTTTAFLSVATLLLISDSALAQPQSIRLEHKAQQWELVLDARGVEQRQLVEAARVLPGEEVLFTVTYTNVGDRAAENVTITNPIPEHMDYLDGSAGGDDIAITFSVDGGRSFADSDELQVTDGQGRSRRARAQDYTHVRWVIAPNLAPGASGAVQFSAVIE